MTLGFMSLLNGGTQFRRLLPLGVLMALTTSAWALTTPRVASVPHAPANNRCAGTGSMPYLSKLGAAPLRFAPPAAEPVERPAAVDAHCSPSVGPTIEALTANPVPIASAGLPGAGKSSSTSEPPRKLLSILPDDTPHEVRADDVMTYFQLPRQNERPTGSGINLPFAPAQPGGSTLPPSSATYQQK